MPQAEAQHSGCSLQGPRFGFNVLIKELESARLSCCRRLTVESLAAAESCWLRSQAPCCLSGPSLQGPHLSQVPSTGTAGHRDLSLRGPGSARSYPPTPLREQALSHRSSKLNQVLTIQTALQWKASHPSLRQTVPLGVTTRPPRFPEGEQFGGGEKLSEMGSPRL